MTGNLNLENLDLNELVNNNKKYVSDGHVATYILALAKANPNKLGVTIVDPKTNKEYSAGDYTTPFPIESISKVPVLILAILDNGLETVFNKISTEPTGFPFNSIMNMEIRHGHKPTNPFVNAEAIATNALVKGKDSIEH